MPAVAAPIDMSTILPPERRLVPPPETERAVPEVRPARLTTCPVPVVAESAVKLTSPVPV